MDQLKYISFDNNPALHGCIVPNLALINYTKSIFHTVALVVL